MKTLPYDKLHQMARFEYGKNRLHLQAQGETVSQAALDGTWSDFPLWLCWKSYRDSAEDLLC